MAEPRTFTLKQPVKKVFNPGQENERVEELTQLTLRTDIRVKDLRVMDGHAGDIAQAIALIAHLSGEPIRTIDELGAEDFGAISEAMQAF